MVKLILKCSRSSIRICWDPFSCMSSRLAAMVLRLISMSAPGLDMCYHELRLLFSLRIKKFQGEHVHRLS